MMLTIYIDYFPCYGRITKSEGGVTDVDFRDKKTNMASLTPSDGHLQMENIKQVQESTTDIHSR